MTAPQSLDETLMKALAHPLRWRILEIVSERGEAGPVELARALDQPLATVSHHVRVLRDSGSLELTRAEQRRGALEHYYRAVTPPFFDVEQWERSPILLRRGVAGQIFRRIVAEATQAGQAGAFDAPEAHVDRMVVELDAEGWRELCALLTDVLRQAQAIEAKSDARRADGETTLVAQIAILSFEMAESIQAAGGAPDIVRPKRSRPLP
jgi:DNA-binding transcriptional ArsR family regulator